jgi:hypothetical protein
MVPDSLNEVEVRQTRNGLLTGWIWLQDYVFALCEDMKERTVIYSDYVNRLREEISEDGLRGIHFVSKKGATSPARELLRWIERVAYKVERGS